MGHRQSLDSLRVRVEEIDEAVDYHST